MKQADKYAFIFLKQNKQQLLLLLFALFLVCIHFLCWSSLASTTLYNSLFGGYTKITGQLTVFIISLLGDSAVFDPATLLLRSNSKTTLLVMPVAAYKFYFAAFFLLIAIPPKDQKYAFLLLVCSVLFIALRAASISIIHLLFSQKKILLLWIDPLIYLPMIALLLLVANKNALVNKAYNRINKRFAPLLIISLPQLILLLIILTPLPRLILNFPDKSIIHGLINITLEISQSLLNNLGYKTIITSNFIFLEKFWLRLEQPCLGIGVVSIIWILVCCIKGSWLNKFIFLSVFSLLFVVMNSVRLSFLLVYIQNTYHQGLNKVELHDNITYFMYLFAFSSFLLYYFWFQDLNLKRILYHPKKQTKTKLE